MSLSPIFFFFFFTIFFSQTSISIDMAQLGRAPHGLVYETPIAFSPSAVEFFHPKRQYPMVVEVMNPCQDCSPLPMAADQMAVEDQSKVFSSRSENGGSRTGFGVGCIVGIVFLVFFTLGVY